MNPQSINQNNRQLKLVRSSEPVIAVGNGVARVEITDTYEDVRVSFVPLETLKQSIAKVESEKANTEAQKRSAVERAPELVAASYEEKIKLHDSALEFLKKVESLVTDSEA